MTTRPLTSTETTTLERQGCHAEDWSTIRVPETFIAENTVTHTTFSGEIHLGALSETITTSAHIPTATGIHNCRLHNVAIGDNCRIAHATIANTTIANNCHIEHVHRIGLTGTTGFPEGSRIHCIAEDGARSIPLWRTMSAQWAHLLLHRRHTPFADALENMIQKDIAKTTRLRNGRCTIGEGCTIEFAGVLENIDLGPYTRISGTACLTGVVTVSEKHARVHIGEGVSAEDCVIQKASRIDSGVRLRHSLVGEGVLLAQDFNAKHSLFFSNCEFTLGEAACVWAGPFAVSHHRATLVLTCQCSFNTFGSAANSSNHHFKLGPRHGGILRRGTRCGSGSYLFWPGDIGAFSTVVGRHLRNLDTAAFPFSLLTVSGEKSVLVPGVNLFSAGIFRDEFKWRDRDRREGIDHPRDHYHAAINSPYSMAAVEQGLDLLRTHQESVKDGGESHLNHGGAVIPASRVQAGIVLYESALVFYLGECLLLHAMETEGERANVETVHTILADTPAPDSEVWRDWGGLLTSQQRASALARQVERGEIGDGDAVDAAFTEMHENYGKDELAWVAACWRKRFGPVSKENVSRFVERWIEVVVYGYERLLKDVAKEFSDEAMLGFGVEGDAREAFRRIRGAAMNEPIVLHIKERRDALLAMAYQVLGCSDDEEESG